MESQDLLELAEELGILTHGPVGLNKLYLIPKKISKHDEVITTFFSITGEDTYDFSVDFRIVEEGVLKVAEVVEETDTGLFEIDDYICSSERIKNAFLKTLGNRPIAAERITKFLITDALKDQLLDCNVLKKEFIEFEVAGSPVIVDSFRVNDGKVESVRFISGYNGELSPHGEWRSYVSYIPYVSAIPGTDLFEFEVKVKGFDRCISVSVDSLSRLEITRFA